jgi:hypothetical protein
MERAEVLIELSQILFVAFELPVDAREWRPDGGFPAIDASRVAILGRDARSACRSYNFSRSSLRSSCQRPWLEFTHGVLHAFAMIGTRPAIPAQVNCASTPTKAFLARPLPMIHAPVLQTAQRDSQCPQCDDVRGTPKSLVVGHGVRTIHYVCPVCSSEWHRALLMSDSPWVRPAASV